MLALAAACGVAHAACSPARAAPCTFPRRAVTAAAIPALLIPRTASAVSRGTQWRLSLPDDFIVARELSSVVRVRAETVLAAESNGVEVKLQLVPLGQQAAVGTQ